MLASCSVYKSSGRSSFEDKSSSNLPAISTQSIHESAPQWSADDESEENEDCWNQPAQDPLWHVADKELLSVKKLNSQQIQVCIIKESTNQTNP